MVVGTRTDKARVAGHRGPATFCSGVSPAIVLAPGIHWRPSTPKPEPALTVAAPSDRHTSFTLRPTADRRPRATPQRRPTRAETVPATRRTQESWANKRLSSIIQKQNRLIQAASYRSAHSCLRHTLNHRLIPASSYRSAHSCLRHTLNHRLIPASSYTSAHSCLRHTIGSFMP